ncbi:MAG: hypothetical protein QOD93_2935 [Acetobacteraceae bacterium]|jgi:hypothetical protein|nr:hypothetical protein [Rhodopila sp.]MEA2769973.1 hypothetical protein [Acetobacteraceae bacterium]
MVHALTLCSGNSNDHQAGTRSSSIVISDEEMASFNIHRAEFHGEWNYTIRPINRSERAVDS